MNLKPNPISTISSLDNVNVTIKRPSKITPSSILSYSNVPNIRLAQYQNPTFPSFGQVFWGRLGNSAIAGQEYILKDRVLDQLKQNNSFVTFSENPGVCQENGLDNVSPNLPLSDLKAKNSLIKLGVNINAKVMFSKGEQSYGFMYKQSNGTWNTKADGTGSTTLTYSGGQMSAGKDLYIKITFTGAQASVTGNFRLALSWVDGGGTSRSDLVIWSNPTFKNQAYYKATLPYFPSSAKIVTSIAVNLDQTGANTGSILEVVSPLNSPGLPISSNVDPESSPTSYRISNKCLNIFSRNNWWLLKDGFPSRRNSAPNDVANDKWRGDPIIKTGVPNLLVFNGAPRQAIIGQTYFDITNQACMNYFIDRIKEYIVDSAKNVQGIDLDHIFFDEITGLASYSLNIENADDNIWIYNFGSIEGLIEGPVNGRIRLSKSNTNAAWQEAMYQIFKRFKKIMPSQRLYINGPCTLNSDAEGRMCQNITQTDGLYGSGAGSPYSAYSTLVGDFDKTAISKRLNMIQGGGVAYPPQYYNTTGNPVSNFTDTELYYLRVWPTSGSTNLWSTGATLTKFERNRKFIACMASILDASFYADDNRPFNWPWNRETLTAGQFGTRLEYQNGTSNKPVITIEAGTNGEVISSNFVNAKVCAHLSITNTQYTVQGSTINPFEGLIITGQRIAPASINTVAGLYAPQIQVHTATNISIKPSFISGLASIWSFQAPSIRLGKFIKPSFIASISSIVGPSIRNSSLKLSPSYILSTSTLLSPRISINQRISVAFIATGAPLQAPAIRVGRQLKPSFISSISGVYAPNVKIDKLIRPSTISSNANIFSPTLKIGKVIRPDFINSTASIYDPHLSMGKFIRPDFIGTTSILIEPYIRVQAGRKLQPEAITSIADIYNPAIRVGRIISPDIILSETTIIDPTIRVGRIIKPDFITSIAGLYNPSVIFEVESLIQLTGESYMVKNYIDSSYLVKEVKGWIMLPTGARIYTGTEIGIKDKMKDEAGSPIDLSQASSIILLLDSPKSGTSTMQKTAGFVPTGNQDTATCNILNTDSVSLSTAGTYEYQFIAVIDGHPYKSTLKQFRVYQSLIAGA